MESTNLMRNGDFKNFTHSIYWRKNENYSAKCLTFQRFIQSSIRQTMVKLSSDWRKSKKFGVVRFFQNKPIFFKIKFRHVNLPTRNKLHHWSLVVPTSKSTYLRCHHRFTIFSANKWSLDAQWNGNINYDVEKIAKYFGISSITKGIRFYTVCWSWL